MEKNKRSKKNIFEKLELLKNKFNLQDDVVSTLKINNYTLLAFLIIGVIGVVVELLLFISLILMHTINALYTSAPLNILFVFLNVFLIFNNIYFITFCVVTYVIYKKEKRNIMYFAPLVAIILTTLSSIFSIASLATNIFEIDWAVFFIQLLASLISLFFFFNNYPNIRKKVDMIFEKMMRLNIANKQNNPSNENRNVVQNRPTTISQEQDNSKPQISSSSSAKTSSDNKLLSKTEKPSKVDPKNKGK